MKRNIEGDSDAVITEAAGGAMVQEVMGAGTPEVESMTMRMWLSNQHAGTIIGKGGTNIKQIREECGGKVTIAEAAQPGAERLVSLTAPPLSINRAVDLMLDKIEEADAHRAANDGMAPAAPAHTLKMCLSNNQVGAVIGKGGATITSLREQSGATIKVEAPPMVAVTTERLVTVGGSKVEVVRAHQLLALKLATVPEDAPSTHPSKYQRTAPMATGVYGMPQGAAGFGQQPSAYGAPYAPSPYAQQAQGQRAVGGVPGMAQAGYYSAQGLANGGFAAQQQQQQSRAYQPQQGYAFAGFGMETAAAAGGGGGSWSQAQLSGGPDGEMTQMVPSALVGRLIGKGGSGIRELRDVSRANIKILSDCEPGTDQRKITVSGTPDAIQMALSMINQRLAQGP